MLPRRLLCPLLALASASLLALASGQAQDAKDEKKKDTKKQEKKLPAPAIPPTAAGVKYGPDERNVLDFWQAKSDAPTPLVLCIHGGGWVNGDKSSYYGSVKGYLDKGISVATINYRLMAQANAQKVTPPVKAPLEDAARALQFVRSKAGDWNIDKKKIGATGGSAGACSSLWLAFHDDMADPKSADPVARESTRLYCAAVNGAQVSLDPKVVREWIPNYTYGAHAFGMKNLDEVEKNRDQLAGWIKEYSPIEHVTKDDPPIGLYYAGPKEPKPGEKDADPTHSPTLGIKLAEKLKATGVDVVYHSAAEPNAKLPTSQAYLIDRLKK
ncbi:alpha/beta hydrolase [Gemmata sp. JC673]|uniref:Alpha/beta hydrolase n=1 Tax=Gemmata algarum TaxID=2975278 RepID=A0ABU5F0U0_9BACT|nr:alpha/beta hydrolase [Gemmata algarum]MDY3561114.1 alpha/beta hydrolase [Gemmata algarum]